MFWAWFSQVRTKYSVIQAGNKWREMDSVNKEVCISELISPQYLNERLRLYSESVSYHSHLHYVLVGYLILPNIIIPAQYLNILTQFLVILSASHFLVIQYFAPVFHELVIFNFFFNLPYISSFSLFFLWKLVSTNTMLNGFICHS